MIKIKICGIMTYDAALVAAGAGADMLGFNFYKQSPRYVEPAAALEICAALRRQLGEQTPALVGLFVNGGVGTISTTMDKVGLDFVQLSGDESVEMLRELRGIAYKAIRPRNLFEATDDTAYFAPAFPQNERIPSLLLDAYHPDLYGGTGETASHEVALEVKKRVPRLMLAGGLTPDNVIAAVGAVQPWGVDVASGVEVDGQKGVKDAAKIEAFVQAVRSVGV